MTVAVASAPDRTEFAGLRAEDSSYACPVMGCGARLTRVTARADDRVVTVFFCQDCEAITHLPESRGLADLLSRPAQ
jgi:hypothetical protein